MGQALMARANVAKTLLNKQHASFRLVSRRGDKTLFSIKTGLLALSQLGFFRPCKSVLALIIIIVGFGMSATHAQASKYASSLLKSHWQVLFSRNADICAIRHP